MQLDDAGIADAFTYHPPTGTQPERYQAINEGCRDLALKMLHTCPPSGELTLAIRALQTARMWANASIAINEDAVPTQEPTGQP